MGRHRDGPQEEFRKRILKRDKNKCRMPGCKNKRGKLEVHHIERYADAPHKRFEEDNAITLCKSHHYEVRGKEQYYVELFKEILYYDRQ